MMKILSKLILCSLFVISFSSCSVLREWGILGPESLKVVERRVYQQYGRTYILRRYLVREQPLEAVVEIKEVTADWVLRD